MDTTINVVEYLKNLAINTPEGFQKTIDSLKKELKSITAPVFALVTFIFNVL